MVLLPDPEVFGSSPPRDAYGALPGKPNWGPMLYAAQAVNQQRELNLEDPWGMKAWDVHADARRRAWLDSPFAKAVDSILPR